MSDLQLRLARALQGRYDVEERIGSGGMAMVFRARDLRLGRDVAIKVLDPDQRSPQLTERFRREVATVAGFSHPYILPLHESGEADGLPYFVMPYVEGESLRARLDRDGALPVQEAVRIGYEVAEALAYAHLRGVLHRDMKPANILLSSGQAVVADFGIARALSVPRDERLTRTGFSFGTPRYMSPEQLEGAEDPDGRSDVFSLGCVLYEMLAGEAPWPGGSVHAVVARRIAQTPRPLHEVREGVSPELSAVVERAMAQDPEDRFADAGELARALEGFLGTGGHAGSRRSTLAGRRRWRAALLAAPVALAAIFLLTRSSEGLGFEERDWIVIAELENHTGEEVFDRSLNTAFTVAVSQSRYVNVFPRQRVQETLSRMGRGTDTPLTRERALEVAIREGLKAVVAPEISSIGETYLLSTHVLAQDGVQVFSASRRVQGRDSVLPALDELSRELREELGESLAMISENSVPLPQATTPSLEALKRYADGSALWGAARYEEARTLWQEAVALDSLFAWAHASLGLAAGWLEGPGAGAPHFQRAMGLLDRVSERERLWIRSLIESGQAKTDALRVYTSRYPDDRDGWYNLGNTLRSQGAQDEALAAYQEAIALDSLYTWGFVNSGMVNDFQGRPREATAHFARAFEIDPSLRGQSIGDINRIAGFALARSGDTLAARETFQLLLDQGPQERANGLRSLALLHAAYGRTAQAVPLLEEAISLNESEEYWLSTFRNRLYLAQIHDLAGSGAAAEGARLRASALAGEYDFGPSWLSILAVQHARAGAGERAQAVLATMEASSSDAAATPDLRATLAEARGEVALAGGRTEEAVRQLETAYGTFRSRDRLESLALAYQAAGRLEDARQAYQEFLAVPEMGHEPQFRWLHAHLRMARVLEALGEPGEAASVYARLVERLEGGDPELPLREEARAALERLGAPAG